MSRIRKVVVAAGTFSFALGIGFVMQNGDVLAARFGAGEAPARDMAASNMAVPGSAAVAEIPREPASAPLLPMPVPIRTSGQAVVTPALPPSGIGMPVPIFAVGELEATLHPAAFEPVPEPSAVPEPAEMPAEGCTTAMRADVLPAGLVALHLSAPCAPVTRVSFHHQGTMFTELTDEAGEISVTVPALAENAVFLADIAGGEGAVAIAEVPVAATLDRAVLQWQGGPGLNLHALEFGADYGGAGHVWTGAPHEPGTTEGGFFVELGDPDMPEPLLVQVYTFPHDGTNSQGEVVLSVDVEVTAGNCGRELNAQSLQLAPGTDMVARDLSLRMPDCAATGELIVLSDMLSDLHLAAN